MVVEIQNVTEFNKVRCHPCIYVLEDNVSIVIWTPKLKHKFHNCRNPCKTTPHDDVHSNVSPLFSPSLLTIFSNSPPAWLLLLFSFLLFISLSFLYHLLFFYGVLQSHLGVPPCINFFNPCSFMLSFVLGWE